LSAITPGPYFHIGGDEAAATRKEDYVTFINRFVEITAKNGKTMVGWEEIAQGNINSSVVTQHWRQQKYALEAVEKGSKLIMSPATRAYIDMSYDSTTKLGLHWAAYIEVDSAYSWDPETQVKGVAKENIIGIEAPLWTETITNMDEIEYMAFPRLLGYAEIGWSPASGRSWDEYKLRLAAHGKRMEALGIDFYRSPKVPWK
jgi:hexosaminidase